MITASAIHALIPGDDDIDLGPDDLAGLTAALQRVAASHDIDRTIILVSDNDLSYAQLIAAMDAARGPGFASVVIAGHAG